MLSLIEKYENLWSPVEIDERESAPSVSVLVKRARLGYKIEFNYRYGSVARMIAHVEEFLAGLERADSVEGRSARSLVPPPYQAALESVKEGDIFVASWGWEQTNIDAYQVIAKKGDCHLREIAVASVEGSEGFMSDRVVPVKDEFIGDAFKHPNHWYPHQHRRCNEVRVLPKNKEFY